MRWIDSTTDLPATNVRVVGISLTRFVNADWEWSDLYIVWHDGKKWCGEYMAPDMWLDLELPPLPESPKRDKARLVARHNRALDEQIAELEAKKMRP